MQTAEVKRFTRVLELDENANIHEIQTAYRKLVLKYHPDVNRAAYSAERFRQIVEAYGSLLELVRKDDGAEWEELKRRIKRDPVLCSITLSELEERLKYSSSVKVRMNAVIALYMKQGVDSKNSLFTALKDGDEGVRLTAIDLLGEICRLGDIVQLIPCIFSLKHSPVAKCALKTTLRILKRIFARVFHKISNQCRIKRSLHDLSYVA